MNANRLSSSYRLCYVLPFVSLVSDANIIHKKIPSVVLNLIRHHLCSNTLTKSSRSKLKKKCFGETNHGSQYVFFFLFRFCFFVFCCFCFVLFCFVFFYFFFKLNIHILLLDKHKPILLLPPWRLQTVKRNVTFIIGSLYQILCKLRGL